MRSTVVDHGVALSAVRLVAPCGVRPVGFSAGSPLGFLEDTWWVPWVYLYSHTSPPEHLKHAMPRAPLRLYALLQEGRPMLEGSSGQ